MALTNYQSLIWRRHSFGQPRKVVACEASLSLPQNFETMVDLNMGADTEIKGQVRAHNMTYLRSFSKLGPELRSPDSKSYTFPLVSLGWDNSV